MICEAPENRKTRVTKPPAPRIPPSVSALSRSAKIFGSATVVIWPMRPVPSMVIERTKKARTISARDASGSGLRSERAATTEPSRTKTARATPVSAQSTPGTMNAARHEMNCVKAPAASAATPTPRLPKMPFQPSALPRLSALRTSQATPTG